MWQRRLTWYASFPEISTTITMVQAYFRSTKLLDGYAGTISTEMGPIPIAGSLSRYYNLPGQLSLDIPPWVVEMNVSQRTVRLFRWRIKAYMTRVSILLC